jgi:hypothetical protein
VPVAWTTGRKNNSPQKGTRDAIKIVSFCVSPYPLRIFNFFDSALDNIPVELLCTLQQQRLYALRVDALSFNAQKVQTRNGNREIWGKIFFNFNFFQFSIKFATT